MPTLTRAAVAGALSVFAAATGSGAETPAAGQVFTLGEVVVRAEPAGEDWPATISRIDRLTLDELGADRVPEALQAAPGVSLSPGNRGGARNETGFFVRGFDQSRVPVLVDGLPIYVPYDGYLDLNRLLTTDLSRIEITKGFAPMVAGPNALGGLVNLVTRRPERPFEADALAALDLQRDGSYGGTRLSSNFGTRQEMFYLQGGIAYLDQDGWSTSKSFNGGLYQPKGERLRSDSEDFRVSGKAGFTPNAEDEYAVGFVVARGEKGAPPYAGRDASRATFFDWPQYDKDSLYFLTRTSLPVGSETYLRTRGFYDTFQNSLYRYDNQTYTTQRLPFSFRSSYDDYSVGGGLELGTATLPGGSVRVGYTIKQDVHREFGPTTPQSRMEDITQSVGLDVTQKLLPWLTATGGVSYEMRDAVMAQDPATNGRIRFNTEDQDAINAQVGLRASLDDRNDLYGSVARRSRFATMFERYSYRLGNGLPNPDLAPERATNVEAGWETRLVPDTAFSLGGFYSFVNDYIQAVTVGRATTAPFGAIAQSQNIGDARFYGIELGVDSKVRDWLRLQANYTYLVRERDNAATTPLYGTPRHKLFALAAFDVGERFQIIPSILAQSGQYTTDTGNRRPIGGWLSANLKATYALTETVSAEVAVYNLTDADYDYDDGYPAMGRSFRLALRARF